MSKWIAFDTAKEVGTVTTIEHEGTERVIRYVGLPEYYEQRIATSANAIAGLVELATIEDVDDADREAAGKHVLDVYWNTYKGILLPPSLSRALKGSIPDGGPVFLTHLDRIVTEVASLDDPVSTLDDRRAETRIGLLKLGVTQVLSNMALARAEFFCDVMYLERLVMEDIRNAEKEAAEEGRSVLDILAEWEEETSLLFQEKISSLLRPSEIIDRMAPMDRPAIELMARSRVPLHLKGVLAVD